MQQPADGAGAPPKMGFMSMVTQGYGELVNAIIRPPRAEYEVADLGARTHAFAHSVRTHDPDAPPAARQVRGSS